MQIVLSRLNFDKKSLIPFDHPISGFGEGVIYSSYVDSTFNFSIQVGEKYISRTLFIKFLDIRDLLTCKVILDDQL